MSELVGPEAARLWAEVSERQRAKGLATYATELHTHNGRSASDDLLDEIHDAWNYAVQLRMEHAAALALLRRLECRRIEVGTGDPNQWTRVYAGCPICLAENLPSRRHTDDCELAAILGGADGID